MGQIVSTKIIAPLGTVAIAAHSFGNTVESICYMPGYGIAAAVSYTHLTSITSFALLFVTGLAMTLYLFKTRLQKH